jgi:DNA-binding NtrC family response regulator
MTMKPRVLLVDDDAALRFAFCKYLSKAGYDISAVPSLAEARKAVASQRFDAILLDLQLPDGHGADWIPEIRRDHQDTAIIVITGHGDVPTAVDAMRQGADNLLVKPVSMKDLDVFLRKSLELETLRRRDQTQRRLAKKDAPFWGTSARAKKVIEMASLAAKRDCSVLLLGESGTGKGVLARWIHDQSRRHAESFVEVNCSALRGELLASELFGHAKGAFTSAVEEKAGLIEIADGGSLFLDEIADMDRGVQAQFLKVVEEKCFRRLGDTLLRRSEFRVICATNRKLPEEVHQGRFRKDLYFRINVFPIELPPLRAMMEDLRGMIQHLLASLDAPGREAPPEVVQMLMAYSWPGNIRELRNILERAIVLAGAASLAPPHFSGLLSQRIPAETAAHEWRLDKAEIAHIQSALEHFGKDIGETAKALGISRETLYRRLREAHKG